MTVQCKSQRIRTAWRGNGFPRCKLEQLSRLLPIQRFADSFVCRNPSDFRSNLRKTDDCTSNWTRKSGMDLWVGNTEAFGNDDAWGISIPSQGRHLPAQNYNRVQSLVLRNQLPHSRKQLNDIIICTNIKLLARD